MNGIVALLVIAIYVGFFVGNVLLAAPGGATVISAAMNGVAFLVLWMLSMNGRAP